MRNSTRAITPLAAVAAGLLTGAVGTVGLDAVYFVKYRRAGGPDGPLAWEFAPVKRWDDAPARGRCSSSRTLLWRSGRSGLPLLLRWARNETVCLRR